MQIDRIDHLNITVADLDRSLEFYERVLGMRTERMGEGRAALLFGKQKIHLDLAGATAMAGRQAAAGAYLLCHEHDNPGRKGAARTLRRADPHGRAARRRDRHDPVRLHRRSRRPLNRDLDLLRRFAEHVDDARSSRQIDVGGILIAFDRVDAPVLGQELLDFRA